MQTMAKAKYTIDLAAQQAECEANYARIMRLLPDMATVDHRDLGNGGDQLWSSSADFSLRIYHDARMAEVVSFNRHRNLRVSYDYPNQRMYQRDEKTQLNLFLGEWLSHCLEYGHTLEQPISIGSC